MKDIKLNIVRFAPKGQNSFYDAVVGKAKAYFETHGISPYANTEMWIKTIVILLLYLVPYLIMISGLGAANPWIFFALWFLMGMGMSGIGTAIMHDGCI
jgi:linoleoyl-CoA desaturase